MQPVLTSMALLLVVGLGSGACGTVIARSTCDELSLVQFNVQTDTFSSEVRGHLHGHLARNFSSFMQLQHIPGIRGMSEQLKEAAGMKLSPPEKGYHKKLVQALPVLQEQCKKYRPADPEVRAEQLTPEKQAEPTQEDCKGAVDIVQMMIKNTEGPEPLWTWHEQMRGMLGLHFWLYAPGTTLCFSFIDVDRNGNITWKEIESVFGVQPMAAMRPIWPFLDRDGEGNVTRKELYNFLRYAILVRKELPGMDPIDPKASTEKCMNMAHRILTPPAAPMKKMKFYPKLLSIAGITVGAFALHCLLCTKSSKKKEVDKPVEEKAKK